MGERRGTKALELWCRRVTEGYPGVSVNNMTTSWRDGLAFCALIHRFRPDLIDFASLKASQAHHNNELAFRVAERHLGIPALLDAEDMVDSHAPDRLSVLTYLAQFYQTFGQASLAMGIITSPGNRAAIKRPDVSVGELDAAREKGESPAKKPWLRPPREPCASCGLPVFLAERLTCGGRTFHRTCFTCARCGAQLSPANCYETESHAFCCEVCPDEEGADKKRGGEGDLSTQQDLTQQLSASGDSNQAIDSSSDEDPESMVESFDEYSSNFEAALEDSGSLPKQPAQLSAFLSSQLAEEEEDDDDEESTTVTSSPALPVISTISNKDQPQSSETQPIIESSLDRNNGEESSNISTENQIGLNNVDLNNCDSDAHDVVLVRKCSNEVDDSSNLCSTSVDLRNLPDENTNTASLVSSRRSLFENLVHKEIDGGSKATLRTASRDDTEAPTSSVLQDTVSLLTTPMLEESLTSLDDSDVNLKQVSEDLEESSVLKIKLESSSSELKEISIENSENILSESTSDKINTDSAKNRDLFTEKCSIDPVDEIKTDTKEEAANNIVGEYNKNLTEAMTPTLTLESQLKAPVEKDTPTFLVESAEEQYPDDLNPFGDDDQDHEEPIIKKESLNPFSSSEDEEDEKYKSEVPRTQARKIIPAEALLNPFWEDGEEEEEKNDREVKTPVPQPRSSWLSHDSRPSPAPRSSMTNSPGSYGSHQTKPRKKNPAPPPPPSPATSSPVPSPRGTMKPRKARPAPPPPKSPAPEQLLQLGEKGLKNEVNRTRQEFVTAERLAPDKSHTGQWKRKKGPAPARPIPVRRQVKALPMAEVRQELELIETQQRGLEKQGVRLESQIRETLAVLVCEGDDESLPVEVEEQVMQLCDLVIEKNELCRRQTELMYLKRQQRLEEQQMDIEWQIRCLLEQPNRGEEEIKREEELIACLVEVVERRNEIVDCLELERRREIDEDRSVREHRQKIADRQHEDMSPPAKEKKKKLRAKNFMPRGDKKEKTKKVEKSAVLDKGKQKMQQPESIENDDTNSTEATKVKKPQKKKWFA